MEYPVIIISGPDGKAIAEAFFQKDTITVGRGEENDICVMDTEMKISREHLRLVKKENEIYLYDLNSRNGTLLNGKKIEPEPACIRLTPKDEVKLGEYTLRLYISVGGSRGVKEHQKGITDAETFEYLVHTPSSLPMHSSTALVRREKLASLSRNDREFESPSPSYFWNFFKILCIGVILTSIGWYLGWWPRKYNPEKPKQPVVSTIHAIEVETIPIQKRDEIVLQGSGYVTVRRKAFIKSLIDGEIEYITVGVNQKVKAGQILVRLNQAEAKVGLDYSRSKLEEARKACQEIESKLRAAKQELKRTKDLYEKGLISKRELEACQSRYNLLKPRWDRYRERIQSAKHQIKMAKIRLDNTLIRAPFSGVIVEKFCEVGEVVYKQGEPLFTLIDRRGIGATIDVNEVYIAKIFIKQKVDMVLTAYPSRKYQGKVRKIMQKVDKQKGTIPVDVVFTNPDDLILPGMTVKATFHPAAYKKEAHLLLPNSALHKKNQHTFLWIFTHDSRAEKRKVKLGKKIGNQWEILQGVQPGEEVIIWSAKPLKEGTLVKKQK